MRRQLMILYAGDLNYPDIFNSEFQAPNSVRHQVVCDVRNIGTGSGSIGNISHIARVCRSSVDR